MAAAGKPNFAGRVAFTYPAFVLYQLARFCIVLATEMQAVAIGWQVYEITRHPLDLGLVALSQFLPGILLFLVSGYTADRFDRRKVLTIGYAGFAVCSGLLLAISVRGSHTAYPLYMVSVLVGIVRSFNAPASRAILPLLVPEEH
ncbi:MAG TPA: MFS transporter, partial [Candidatus Acidoferrales bacterium]|nr:MFS transporter [Candidatus Acidoferrales bacterium]